MKLLAQMMNDVTCGECADVMAHLPRDCIDFILTDPPYITRYRDRSGRRIVNDDNTDWLQPAFFQMHRVLKPDSFCVSFYGWTRADLFVTAARAADFRIAGHIVFPKRYASKSHFLRAHHEQAFLLAKGRPAPPENPLPDVLEGWTYTGNRLHPTQKPLSVLTPLVDSFTEPGAVVMDPFCGSGSTLKAAQKLQRRYVGIELDPAHHATARARLKGWA